MPPSGSLSPRSMPAQPMANANANANDGTEVR